MRNKLRLLASIAVLTLAAAGCLSASLLGLAVNGAVVNGTAEIYSAGQASALDPMGALPPGFNFAAAPGQTLTFSSVTGTTTCGAGCVTAGPDGVLQASFPS